MVETLYDQVKTVIKNVTKYKCEQCGKEYEEFRDAKRCEQQCLAYKDIVMNQWYRIDINPYNHVTIQLMHGIPSYKEPKHIRRYARLTKINGQMKLYEAIDLMTDNSGGAYIQIRKNIQDPFYTSDGRWSSHDEWVIPYKVTDDEVNKAIQGYMDSIKHKLRAIGINNKYTEKGFK